ncbi:MAG: hypothetical protein Q7R84_03225 [bacterium]|nr:hypothetical protein [bacterium]
MAKSIVLIAVVLLAILWPATNVGAQSQNISVSSRQGRIGETFSVTGRGFNSFVSVEIQFADKRRSVVTDYYGEFRTSFIVPPTESGMYWVIAVSGGKTVFTTYEILPPGIAISPQLLMAGDKLSIWIWGAMPYDTARVYLGNNEITPSPRPMIGADGSAGIQTMIPSLPPGYYLLIVKGTRFEVNLVVFLIPDSPGKIENAISPIKDKLVRIWGYYGGTWLLYDPLIPPELNSLMEFAEGSGYFIIVKENCELAAVGGRVYKLYKGANLIGW